MAQGQCDDTWLADRFEEHRRRLRAVAYRMLGSLTEADDAVQDTWLRVSEAGADGVENFGGWLTTIVARVCLNRLRSRRTRPEEPVGVHVPDPVVSLDGESGPEAEALLADYVGLALQVVLDTLRPAERLAFVLHDVFDVPFEAIAPLVGRTPTAARQLASRARRRVQVNATPLPDSSFTSQRAMVDAFFAAARRGDFEGLVALLDPNIVLRADGGKSHPEQSAVLHGAGVVARQAIKFARAAADVRPVVVNGAAGALVTMAGRPMTLMAFTVADGRIAEIDGITDPERLLQLGLDKLGD